MKPILQSVHPVLMSSNLSRSVRFFDRLGFELRFLDEPSNPRYAAIKRDDVELHLQWHDQAQSSAPHDRPVYRLIVSDVDALYAEFLRAGALTAAPQPPSPWSAPGNTAWGTREFHLHDPDGNGLQFYRPLKEETILRSR